MVPSFTWRVPHVAGKYLSDTEKKLAMHAGHAETALMLALAPDTVHMERAVVNYPPVFDSPLLSPDGLECARLRPQRNHWRPAARHGRTRARHPRLAGRELGRRHYRAASAAVGTAH